MDTSEQYIKMCYCGEIQAHRPEPTISGGNFWHYPEGELLADITWLPRQDQLQAMYLKTLPQDEQESANIQIVMLDDFQD